MRLDGEHNTSWHFTSIIYPRVHHRATFNVDIRMLVQQPRKQYAKVALNYCQVAEGLGTLTYLYLDFETILVKLFS